MFQYIPTLDDLGLSASNTCKFNPIDYTAPHGSFVSPGVSNVYGSYDDFSGLIGTDPEGDWQVTFAQFSSPKIGTLYYLKLSFDVYNVDTTPTPTPTPTPTFTESNDEEDEDAAALNIKAGILPLLSLV